MGATIDILIRLKQLGGEILKETTNDLKKLQANVAAVKVAPFVALREELEKISTATKASAADIAKIKDVVLDTVDSVVTQMRESVTGGVEQTADRSLKVVEQSMARVFAIVGGGVIFQKFLGLGAVTAALKGDFSAISIGLVSFGSALKNIANVVMTKIVGDVRFILDIFGPIGMQLTYFQSVGGLFLSIFRTVSTTTLLIPLALNQTWFLLKRITGHASTALTPLQHTSNLMVSINTSLNSAFLTLQTALVPLLGVTIFLLFFGSAGLFVAIPR